MAEPTHSPAQMAAFAALACYRALRDAPGKPGAAHRVLLTEHLFRLLQDFDDAVKRVAPNISESLDNVAEEMLRDAQKPQKGN